jgi:uncharacterized protein YndB with AHSA1/START domain
MMMTAEARDFTREPYVTRTSPTAVRVERLLPGPVERVWSYLTDPAKRAKWFAGGAMELRPQGALTLEFHHSDLSGGQPKPDASPHDKDPVVNGVIVECVPPHRLTFNWQADGQGSETTFALAPEGTSTRLTVTHHRLSGRPQMLNVSCGWDVHLGILLDILSDREHRLFWPENAAVKAVYEARLMGE